MSNNIKDLIKNYTDDDVENVEPLKHIRMKPSMYIGSVSTPLHPLIEVINNSVDEATIGVASKIEVILHKDGSISVEDDGRGLPVNYSKKLKNITSRSLLTLPNTGKGLVQDGKTSSGTSQNGIGGKANLALSDWFKMEVYRDGYIWYDSWETVDNNPGVPTTKLEKQGTELPKEKLSKDNKDKHGTKLHWLPSSDIYDSINIEVQPLSEFLHQMAYLNPGLELTLTIEKSKKSTTWKESGGIEAMVKQIVSNNQDKLLTPIYNIKSDIEMDIGNNIKKKISASISTAWVENSESVKTILFTNQVANPDLGTPAKGFKMGISKAINKKAKELKLSKETIEQRDILPGLVAVISITMEDPKFSGQTKREVTSSEAQPALIKITEESLNLQFDRTIDKIKSVIKKAQQRAEARKKEQDGKINFKAKDIQKKISEKLSPARHLGEKSELWIVEGDSAGGTLNDMRYVDYQAVLPLRGKVINTLKSSKDKSLSNVELATLFTALGTGIGKNFDIKKLNYGKLIIANDSDNDGFAISNLILTAILTFMPELIRTGHVYRIETPLFVNTLKDGTQHFSYNDSEQTEFLKKNKKNIKEISRNKGLGELSKEMVYDTMVNPETRRLRKFIMNDENEGDVWDNLEKFMGKNTDARKEVFFDEGRYADELDA
jgi:Type IIA topoisomerase (DNA gyrase/topo II, topoisomerase IV), B subunit